MDLKIITDASCNLPPEWFGAGHVMVLPIGIRVGDKIMQDDHSISQTIEFYENDIARKGVIAESVPPDEHQIEQFLLERAALETDHALGLTVTANRSPIFERFTKAGHSVLGRTKAVREPVGRSNRFALRVVDTGNMFAGQGALVAAAVRLIQAGADAKSLREQVEALRSKTWGYLIPNDLYYVRARAKKKGEGSVGIVKYALGTALNIRPILACNQGETTTVASIRGGFESCAEHLFTVVTDALQQRKIRGTLAVSYGGATSALDQFPGFAKLQIAARAADVDVITSTMSMTAGVNVGVGGLSVGMIADEAPL